MASTLVEAPVHGAAAPATRAPIEHLAIICSKGTLDMAYPGLILANAARMSGIDATLFFTFWGLDIVTKKTIDRLHVPTVGNPSMHIPTMVGGLPGMESLATTMMQKQMEKLEIPPVHEMIEILADSGAHLYACRMAMDIQADEGGPGSPDRGGHLRDGLLRKGRGRTGAVHLTEPVEALERLG